MLQRSTKSSCSSSACAGSEQAARLLFPHYPPTEYPTTLLAAARFVCFLDQSAEFFGIALLGLDQQASSPVLAGLGQTALTAQQIAEIAMHVGHALIVEKGPASGGLGGRGIVLTLADFVARRGANASLGGLGRLSDGESANDSPA